MLSLQLDTTLAARLTAIVKEGRYRVFTPLKRHCGAFPRAALFRSDIVTRDSVTVWCSNDYLGLGQNKEILQAMHSALDDSGAGCGGTRNISGTHRDHVLLEKALADYHSKEAALLFSSGYVANLTCLATLGAHVKDLIIYSDANNHNSIIEGIRLSRCEKRIFAHNDAQDLDRLMRADARERPKVVVFESVYSMDGDIAPLDALLSVAESHKALTYLDEVHAVGLYGPEGAGIAARDAVEGRVDILQGTLAKAFGTFGGYIAASARIVDFIRSFGNGFIFTTSLPPVVIAGALQAIEVVRNAEPLRQAQQNNARLLREQLRERAIPFMETSSHIVPVLIKNPNLCRKVADCLLFEHGLYMQPINYPTVERGTERLRLTPSPLHDLGHITELSTALSSMWDRFSLERALVPEVCRA